MEILKIISLCSFLCALTQPVDAQERITVKDVPGEWVVSNDITLPEAREKAIASAKAEAMRQAGVPEAVTESSVLYRADAGTQRAELFQSITGVDVFGEIAEFNVVREEKKFNEVGNLIYYVWLDAKVVLHKDAKDAGFTFAMKGLHDKYVSPDKLTFEIKPAKDGYLTLFILSENEGAVLYPNRIEKNEILRAGHAIHFPSSSALEYEVSTEKESEVNYLIVLFTKQDIPFVSAENASNILRFISEIHPAQKVVKTHSFVIRKESK
jgi:hypothetical protein